MDFFLIFAVCLLCAGIVLLLRILSELKKRSGTEIASFEIFEKSVRELRDDAERTRFALEKSLREFREENTGTAQRHAETVQNTLAARSRDLNETLHSRFETFTQTLNAAARTQAETLDTFREAQRKSADESRETLAASLEKLREENSKKLDEMRGIVDEKLQSALEKRIGESFRLVSERLESVHKSLGEMQSVAGNVVDLKRVLTNVKTRGTWGEVQLGNLLETMLAPEQFSRNVKPRPRGNEIVEFAVRLPGTEENGNAPVWLPVDSKFPKEDYERLVEAAERADASAVEAASKQLADAVEKCARDIRNKYIAPPHTTDFAVLFVPTEGLYSEILRRPGLAEKIQRECRVLVAGPTSFAALLNSLQMGFRTLAIRKNSAKIAKTLLAVKKDFETFGELLEKIGKKISEAQSAISQTADRHRKTSEKLERFEALEIETEA
ncbi:MAG: DNA recombination protein RmuC [Opitutales bacterium]|nr:DNA recombination protein RmuC [Opitutales bacterium]